MKSIRKNLLVSLVLFMGLGISVAGASYFSPNLLSNHPFLKELVEKFVDYQENNAEDKVYLHLDKKFYEPGEDIWFNAYVRDAQTFKPSEKSGVVYVEFLNPKGSPEGKLTLIAQDGKAAGDFHLPEELKGGLYKIKAYTKWQENTNTFFEREITIQKSVLPNLNMELNFDRKAYGIGEKVDATIDLNTLTNQPLAHHLFNYVVSLDGNVIKKGESKTSDAGRSNLQFKLPKNLETNDGLLNIMFQYKGQTESISRSIPIVLGNIDLQFYPEGGELIEGMICGVGFKGLNEFGKPADIKGNIIDQNDKVVATFDSYHQGMGKFELAPQAGVKYFAKITSPANINKTYELPTTIKKGYTLKMHNQNANNIDLEIVSSEKEELFLVAQSRNQIYYSKDIQAHTGINRVMIPTTDFPIGIVQLTLFDSKKIARAERLVFANQDKKLNIKVKTDKEKYLPREKVDMTLEVTDERGIPMPGNFSLAVVDDKLLTFADDKQGHILSHMLLESDLQGEIVEPNFYFDNENDPKRLKPETNRGEALDHLLMTQGWRKFAWEEVLDGKYAAYATAGERTNIAGAILGAQGQPLSGATVELVGQNKKQITNRKGEFDINDWKLYQSVAIQVSTPDYYPVTTTLQDYNSNLVLKMFKKRVITGVVKNKQNQKLPYMQVVAEGVPAIATDAKGEFTITIPENIKDLTIYGGGYGSEIVSLKENVNQVKVVMEYVSIKTTSAHRNDIPRVANQKAGWGKNKKGVRRNVPVFDVNVEELREEPMPAPAPDPVAVQEEEEIEGVEVEKLVEKKADKEQQLLEDGEVEDEIAGDEWNDLGVDGLAMEDVGIRLPKGRSAFGRGQGVATRYNRVRQFPVINYEKSKVPAVRTDFRKTIYWNPNVVVGKDGKANLTCAGFL